MVTTVFKFGLQIRPCPCMEALPLGPHPSQSTSKLPWPTELYHLSVRCSYIPASRVCCPSSLPRHRQCVTGPHSGLPQHPRCRCHRGHTTFKAPTDNLFFPLSASGGSRLPQFAAVSLLSLSPWSHDIHVHLCHSLLSS